MSELGARLYAIVQEYAAIGAHHRTGTAEDARTLDWFENRVRALGATTERQPWSFDRYDAEWSVTIDGADAAALPLFYEGTGEIDSVTPFVAAVSAVPAGTFPRWATIVEDARSAGASSRNSTSQLSESSSSSVTVSSMKSRPRRFRFWPLFTAHVTSHACDSTVDGVHANKPLHRTGERHRSTPFRAVTSS